MLTQKSPGCLMKIVLPTQKELFAHAYKGLEFFDVIYEPNERLWSSDINLKSLEISKKYPEEFRTDWVLSYDLTVKRIDNSQVVVHHRIVPFVLDDKGNIWMSLAYAVISGRRKFGNPTLINKKLNIILEYIDGQFIKKTSINLSEEEMQILRFLVKGYTGDHISKEL